jgi:hypothetical protein
MRIFWLLMTVSIVGEVITCYTRDYALGMICFALTLLAIGRLIDQYYQEKARA